MAGTTRLEYPANVRMMRFPCTGRMSPLMILRAFEQGADGVLVSGCHPGDCHYVQGNLVARRRFTVFRSLMDFLGHRPNDSTSPGCRRPKATSGRRSSTT